MINDVRLLQITEDSCNQQRVQNDTNEKCFFRACVQIRMQMKTSTKKTIEYNKGFTHSLGDSILSHEHMRASCVQAAHINRDRPSIVPCETNANKVMCDSSFSCLIMTTKLK